MILFLHVGAFEGIQSLFGHILDSVLPLLVSSWECTKISTSLSYGRTIRLHFNALLILFQISISHVFSLCCTLIPFLMFQDRRFVLNLDLPSWVRV